MGTEYGNCFLLFPPNNNLIGLDFSHWCEQGDGLDQYGWLQHDGSSFGVQEVVDGPFIITTSFVKRLGGSNGGDWTARVSVDTKV